MRWRQHTCQIEPLERRCLLSFVTATSYPTGAGNEAAAGDFNGDGTPDLAVVGVEALAIMLGDGNGSFHPAVTHPQPFPFGYGVSVGEFNGDGSLDLAVIQANTAGILLGNGDGTFGAVVSYAAGADPRSIAVADFNRDGAADVAVANFGSNAVSILLGNGNGSFQSPVSYSTDSGPIFVTTGDFNGDGAPDLAAVSIWTHRLSVLLGNGNGTFQPRVSYATGELPLSIAVADLDGDGDSDLTVANLSSDSISIFRGIGNGAFLPAVSHPAGVAPRSIAAADFNRDGAIDLVVTNGPETASFGLVHILPGLGNGTFGSLVSYVSGVPHAVVVQDLDGDGAPDIITTNNSSDTYDKVNLLRNRGDGSFRAAASYAVGYNPSGVATSDFNGDGFADLAVANREATVSILLGRGDGSFGAAAHFSDGQVDQKTVAVGDFNRDGAADLAISSSTAVALLLGGGDGTFGTPSHYGFSSQPTCVVAGDLNGDGKLDLAVSLLGSLFFPGREINILLGNGDGTFSQASILLSGAPLASVAVADFDGNGHLDLAALHTDVFGGVAEMSVLLGNGDGTFGAQQKFPISSELETWPQSVAAGDFNGDGARDLVVANRYLATVSVLLGHGDGTFHPWTEYPAGISPFGVVLEDFNGDGTLDLAVSSNIAVFIDSQTLNILLGNGDGTFRPKLGFNAGTTPYQVAAGDFNGDGSPDLATANYESNMATVLLNDAIWTTKTWVGPASGGEWFSAANWSPAGVPSDRDVVSISGSAVDLSESATIGRLDLTNGATITVAAGGGRVLRVSSLSIGPNSAIDLNDNGLIIDYTGASSMPTLRAAVHSGYAAGAWNGPGINSSTAAATSGAGLGFGESSELFTTFPASFLGQSVDATSILVRYTLLGDANLDGAVNLADFNRLAANFGQSPRNFSQGDFNYDGVVNLKDFNLLAGRFGVVLSGARGAGLGARGDRFGTERMTVEERLAEPLD